MKKFVLFVMVCAAAVACSQPKTLQDRLTVNDKEINEIIAQMTLEEKVEMMHSKTIMSSEGVPRLGIQDIKYADGPFGVREEVADGFRPKGWTTDSATYFPTGSALAATWSPELAYDYGNGIGVEARKRGKDIMLGPAINIQRLPVGGRTYEYLSEDPILAAALATEYTLGMQAAGTAACLKHYALNNQETNRGSVDVIVDERPMREIYLKPFEDAVVKGGAMAIMPAYNKVNGYYGSENFILNNEIARGEWGFNGLMVSDWGGTHSTMGAALGGLNVQMTGSNYFGPALIDSVRAGKIDEEIVNSRVREILRVRYAIEAIPEDQANLETASQPESRQTAYNVATKSVVLLKNNGGLLPIDANKVKKIAVIGRHATLSTAAGGMGAGVKTPYEITPLLGLQNRAKGRFEITYAPAYKNYAGMFGRMMGGANAAEIARTIDEAPDAEMLAEAVALAKEADLVIFVAGTGKNIETEGSDRQNIMLPVGQDQVIKALAEVNPNIVTVIISGGPVDLNEVNKYSPAIVQGWWNGIEGGHALADILYGDIAPSGKLPFTFPIKLEDSPAYALGNFPQKQEETDVFAAAHRDDITGGQQAPRMPRQRVSPKAYYTEGMYVGYRWFDTKNVPVMYAFGHGLSYVTFDYANIETNKKSYKANDVIKVTFDLTNNGDMVADEVAQLYVTRLDATVEWPVKELKAFDRITLQPGETKSVTLEVPVSSLRYWNVETHDWALENGNIEIMVGTASDDLRLKTQVAI
ncbi:MAG: glycoside hydrolase family 3 C-terminal domain-containing protein [Tidjanibacter sp.]|nr:glycoside hydrolase family 3 C-terminal domain-containing protein [Tidjanibacter sp.]MBR4064310.1 glycoside hydrolase family 3 C-terminal domain-containing protein [Tidjanibacter sp.]MBR6813625.1 glycoside hydrolase family 3 C-terminal domain-containing protein [Tidjanibacter sp.]